MAEFSYHKSAVYIFENSKAQRVKVGTTIMSTSNVFTRLEDVNNIWRGKKATCQICGYRRFTIAGFIRRHVVSGISCPGGNKLPLEKDVMVAESHLGDMKNRLSKLSGVEKGSATRIINNLEKRIKKFRHYKLPDGDWQFRAIYYTENAGAVEALSHKILKEHLDKLSSLGEVFCCSVSVAIEAVEAALSQLGLLNSTKRQLAELKTPSILPLS